MSKSDPPPLPPPPTPAAFATFHRFVPPAQGGGAVVSTAGAVVTTGNTGVANENRRQQADNAAEPETWTVKMQNKGPRSDVPTGSGTLNGTAVFDESNKNGVDAVNVADNTQPHHPPQTVVYVPGGAPQQIGASSIPGASVPSATHPHPQPHNVVQAIYQPMVSYVAAAPHPPDATQPFMHHPHASQPWPPPGASIAWVQAPQAPGQPAAVIPGQHAMIHGQPAAVISGQPAAVIGGQQPHVAHPGSYPPGGRVEYHQMAAGMPPIAFASPQFAQVPGAVWAPVPHPGHTSFQSAVAVPGHGAPPDHYAHFIPSSHPVPMPVPGGIHLQTSVPQRETNRPSPPKLSDSGQKGEAKDASSSRDGITLPPGPSDRSNGFSERQQSLQSEKDNAMRQDGKPGEQGGASESKDGLTENPPKTQGANAEQPVRKARKPYTITKHRELWTPKEHQLFLQALQLYNRDWKRIETYIGTKTVLQIRSHAQKHFGKVTKYKTGEYIPPPRPKRRATRPYPRSRPSPKSKTQSGPNGSHVKQSQDNGKNGSDTGAGSSGAGSSDNGSASGNGKSGSGGSSNSGNLAPLTSTKDGSQTQPPPKPMIGHDGSSSLHRLPTQPQTGQSSSAPYPVFPQGYERYYFGNSAPSAPPYHPGYFHPYSYSTVPPHLQPLPYTTCYDPNSSQYQAHHAPHFQMTQSQSPHVHQPAGKPVNSSPRPSSSSPMNATKNSTPARQPTGGSSQQKDHVPKPDFQPQQGISVHPLQVLSSCADMNNASRKQSPRNSWDKDAAARRAHRVRIIRERKAAAAKSSLPGSVESEQPESPLESCVPERKPSPEAACKLGEVPKKSANRQTEKPNGVSSLLNSGPPGPRIRKDDAAILIDAGNGTSATMLDDGSDEAVAGFSGSDSTSDVPQTEGQGRSRSPEDDPNSSGGDDGRGRNSRSSSPTDPNSSGSREDTPNGSDPTGSQNVSPPGETPTDSRETTPSDNGEQHASDFAKGMSKQPSNSRSSGGTAVKAHETLKDAAVALTKYSNAKDVSSGKSQGSNRKAEIGNLLNESPPVEMAKEERAKQEDHKRGRSPTKQATGQATTISGTCQYEYEPDSQRRKHSSKSCDPRES